MAAMRERSTSERRVVKKARGGQASSVRWTTIDVEETVLAHNSNSAVMLKTPAMLYSSLAVVAAALPRPSPSPRKRPAARCSSRLANHRANPFAAHASRSERSSRARLNNQLGRSRSIGHESCHSCTSGLLRPSSTTAHSPAVMVPRCAPCYYYPPTHVRTRSHEQPICCVQVLMYTCTAARHPSLHHGTSTATTHHKHKPASPENVAF
jgi:hypothetical protein